MRRMRRGLMGAAVAVAAVALGLTAGVAPAHKLNSGSFLELNPVATSETTIQYDGRVNSASKFCRSRRAVQLFVGGIRQTTVTTDGTGRWSVSGTRPPQGTEVTAVIKRKVKRSRGHRHSCGGDSLTKKAQ
jgi:hypothetical protein